MKTQFPEIMVHIKDWMKRDDEAYIDFDAKAVKDVRSMSKKMGLTVAEYLSAALETGLYAPFENFEDEMAESAFRRRKRKPQRKTKR